ncbi:hypothetical protein F5Y17DRAFT_237271 [Xylariaceae sp. FL0594]|nr:hypothetical protein F5Y17DRAFT_237271 [Xylariaceae sp. FL0594]
MAYHTQGNSRSPRDEVSPHESNPIPLICFVCPKNSRFSDLSHLLTHISSKGHLHNMFQLNLSRDVDESAALALAKFNDWYEKNGISALLRARKTAREQRGGTDGRSQTPMRGSSSAAQNRGVRGGRASRRGRGSGTSKRRTRHDEEYVKDVVKLESDEDDDDEYPRGHGYHPSPAPSYGWSQNPIYPGEQIQYPSHIGSHLEDFQEDEDDSSIPEPSELHSPFPSEDTPDTVEDDTGALILKGVVYPGMAGFDSATEKDRRMRNQKKDPAVLMKLETNSQLVTRAEEVLDTNLAHQRTRDVYDEPSIDGSDGEDDDTVVTEIRPKRRPTQAKTYAPTRRRPATRARRYGQTPATGRETGRGSRPSHGAGLLAHSPSIPLGRSARRHPRSSSHSGQLPIHGHGLHAELGPARHLDGLDGDHGGGDGAQSSDELSDGTVTHDDLTGFRAHLHTPIGESLRRPHPHRLPDLALRPGNPNATFASPMPDYKKSPSHSHYPGKENGHLHKSSASSYNAYLHPPSEVMEPSNYNPLCQPPPRDGFGFRLYSIYDEDPKPTIQPFHPVNSPAYDAGHLQGMMGSAYHSNHSAGDEFMM